MHSDRALVAGIQARDGQAFEALMARHGPAICARIMAIVRDPAASDDLTQEVFLRLWTRSDQWHGKGSVKAWLMRIGTNLALNHLRSVRRQRTQPLAPPPPPGADEDDPANEPTWMIDLASMTPDREADLAEQRRRVRRLIKRLPGPRRDVLRLVYESQMSIADAAKHLGIPLGTAKSRLHYTLRDLARQWNEPGDLDELDQEH